MVLISLEVDAVCSVASEELKMEEWGVDVVLTATQKGLGVPPGLSVLVASPRAVETFKNRKAKATSYFANWKKWLPIMEAYEKGNAAYFATPPGLCCISSLHSDTYLWSVNLIYALHRSLTTIVAGPVSIADRIKMHSEASQRVRAAAAELGLKQVALDHKCAANGMTALYFPEGISAPDMWARLLGCDAVERVPDRMPCSLPRLVKRDVIVAGGLHKDIKDKYFRIGHMGISVVDPSRGDVDKIVESLKAVVAEALQSKGESKL
jgi:alanine-glyoxylate transaminase/serine-glyoxylate transaminase/serine-pyruvate transaminase